MCIPERECNESWIETCHQQLYGTTLLRSSRDKRINTRNDSRRKGVTTTVLRPDVLSPSDKQGYQRPLTVIKQTTHNASLLNAY